MKLTWRLGALAAIACATAPDPPRVSGPVWPASPAAAQVRWLGTFPDAATARGKGFWNRTLDVVIGEETPVERGSVLLRPTGIAAEAGGFVVADPDGRQVLRVREPGHAVEPVRCGGPWIEPVAVAVAPGGVIFVADAGAGALWRWQRARCSRIGARSIERPVGVTWAGTRLYVVDLARHQVVVLSSEGAEIMRLGASIPGEDALYYPNSVAVRPDGAILVTDTMKFRVAEFTADGRFRGAFGQAGDLVGGFGRPKGLAISQRHVFVSDAQHDAILAFRPEGAFDLAVGQSGSGPGELSLPAALSIAGDRLYVADAQNGRVQVLELVGELP